MAVTRWSLEDMPSLAGKSAVVTGSNTGIGWVVARELVRAGAEVTLACRNLAKADDAVHRIHRVVHHHPKVGVVQLDLSSLASVRQCAKELPEQIDLLVNNAGVALVPRWTATEDGFEMQLGTNHFGHFALTGLLLPRLLAARAGRVVTVSSLRAKLGSRAVLDPVMPADYRGSIAYAQSKFANLVFARELERRAQFHGARLTSTAAHPGVAATDVASEHPGIIGKVGPPVMRMLFPSPEAGALPVLYAAVAGKPGSFTGPQRLFESRGPLGPAKVNPLADDPDFAARLWNMSERLTGVAYQWG